MERLEKLRKQLSVGDTKTQTELHDEGRTAVIYLNSQKDLNSLSEQMKKEIAKYVIAYGRDPRVKVNPFRRLQ